MGAAYGEVLGISPHVKRHFAMQFFVGKLRKMCPLPLQLRTQKMSAPNRKLKLRLWSEMPTVDAICVIVGSSLSDSIER